MIAPPPRVVRVSLLATDLLSAAQVGVRRRCRAIERHQEPYGGAPTAAPHLWSQDIDAACAELAVALYLDLPWSGEAFHARADVGTDIQVRHTWHPLGHLIIRAKDRGPKFVFVTGHDGEFDLHGWQHLGAIKQDRWRKQDGNVYWMLPQDYLEDMESIR